VVRTDIEQQQALAILREQPVVCLVIVDRDNAGAFTSRRVDGGDRLLAAVKARRSDREISNAPCCETIRTELMNRYAVRAALANEETSVSAIQRSNMVSILTRRRKPAVDYSTDESWIFPNVFGTQNVAGWQASQRFGVIPDVGGRPLSLGLSRNCKR
jgi:hypothetical protein